MMVSGRSSSSRALFSVASTMLDAWPKDNIR
jgi:hypothetical protein